MKVQRLSKPQRNLEGSRVGNYFISETPSVCILIDFLIFARKTMKARLEDQGKCGIYRIYHKDSNKSYVGKSIDICGRIWGHVGSLNRKTKDENRHLINAWNKYGKDSFDYEILELVDQSLLSEKELHYMQVFNSLDRKSGYNLRMDSSGGMIPHQETRLKMSVSQKLRKETCPETYIEVGVKISEFWNDNPERKEIMSEKVRMKKTQFSILQYDMDMNLIEEFFGFKDVSNKYPDFYRPAIYSVCRGQKKSYRGFIWRYKDKSTEEVTQVIKVEYLKSKTKRTTTLYDVYSVDEELLYSDITARELVPHFNVCYSSVLKWLKTPHLAEARGYKIHTKI